MLKRLFDRLQNHPVDACLCTLAIHPPYRRRAQLLIADVPSIPWIVLTDDPHDFAHLPVRAIHHEPTGPMAIDFHAEFVANGSGRPAYHDKRFVLQTALEEFATAIFIDADSRIRSFPRLPHFAAGIADDTVLLTSIADHLNRWGPKRKPAFEQLAVELTGNTHVLTSARWFSESLFAITKDGNESKFFAAWERSEKFLQSRDVFTGEGGVIGLAAACAGWTVDYRSLAKLERAIQHEGRGPKTV